MKLEIDTSNGVGAVLEGFTDQPAACGEDRRRVVAYLRANARRDRDDDLLDGQQDVLQRFADDEGKTIAGWYADIGPANPKVGALARLLDDVAAPGRDWDCVLIESVSRLSLRVQDLLLVQRVLREYGIELVSAADGRIAFVEDSFVIEIMRTLEDFYDEAMASRRRARRA